MKLPVLFPYDVVMHNSSGYPDLTTLSNTLGIGVLSDCISCVISVEMNGDYACEIEYPIDGAFYSDINFRSVIVLDDRWSHISSDLEVADPAVFRVARIVRDLGGVARIYCNHISYDLANVPVCPFTIGASEAYGYIEKIKRNAVTTPTIRVTGVGSDTFKLKHSFDKAESMSALMMGGVNSVVSLFGGFWKFNGLRAQYMSLKLDKLPSSGIVIRKGSNVEQMTLDTDIFESYTGVYPFYSGDGGYLELSEKIIDLGLPIYETCNITGMECGERVVGTVIHPENDRVAPLILDLSDSFDNIPTESELRSMANAYISEHNIGSVGVNLSVGWINLMDSPEFSIEYPPQGKTNIRIGRTVDVRVPGFSGITLISGIKFDYLLYRPTEIKIGTESTDFINAIVRRS